MSHQVRNLAKHHQRRIAATAKQTTESYQGLNDLIRSRNGRFDMGSRQLCRIRLRPCGATMGSVGTCSTVL